MRAPTALRGGAQRARLADEERERRLHVVRAVIERFACGLARLIAGHEPEFGDCITPAVATQLCASVRPFLDSGDAMRPDFGDYGELRVEGDLLAAGGQIHAILEFDDRSVRQTFTGRLSHRERRRIRLTLNLTLQPCEIVAVQLAIVPPS